jgi:hypothetical protein
MIKKYMAFERKKEDEEKEKYRKGIQERMKERKI